MYDDGLDPDAPFDDDVWELYHVAEDLSECHDLADDGARAARARWSSSGGRRRARYHVLPLDNRPLAAILNPRPTPFARPRPRTSTGPYGAPVPENVAVNVRNRIARDHGRRRRARRRVAPRACCSRWATVLGGWSFHVLDGRLRYVHNLVGKERHAVDVRRRRAARRRTSSRSRSTSRGDFTRHRAAARRRRGRRRGRDRHHDAGAVLDHRRGAHLRLGAGPAGRRRLRGAVPLHRHAAPGRRRRRRRRATATPRPSSRPSCRSSERTDRARKGDLVTIIDSDQHLVEYRGLWEEHIDPALTATRRSASSTTRSGNIWVHVARPAPRDAPRCRRRARPTRSASATTARARGEPRRAALRRRAAAATTGIPRPARERLAGLGLDEAVLFPNYGLLWERTLDRSLPRAARATWRAWNRWCATVVAEGRGRLHPVAHLSPARPRLARRRAARARSRRACGSR